MNSWRMLSFPATMTEAHVSTSAGFVKNRNLRDITRTKDHLYLNTPDRPVLCLIHISPGTSVIHPHDTFFFTQFCNIVLIVSIILLLLAKVTVSSQRKWSEHIALTL